MKASAKIIPQAGSASILTDGQMRMSYEECSGIFEGVDAQLSQIGVDERDCLAFYCEYTLANALLWLFLLEQGYSFLVIAVNKCAKASDLPKFCRYSISAELVSSGEQVLGLTINCDKNPCWQNYRSDVAHPQIFFRTSGTTGSPKLAVHSRDKLIDNSRNCLHRLNLESDDRLTIPVPLYHMFGLGAAFLPGVLAGASIDLQANSNLLRFLQREKEFEPNITFLTPSFMATLVKGRKGQRAYDLTVVAGDILKQEVFQRYEKQYGTVVQLYGSTEMGAISCALASDSAELRATSVGRPMMGVQCKTDSEVHEAAELFCKHDFGFEGYIDDSGSIESRDSEDWYATCDLAQINSENSIRIIGRNDQCVNRSGVLVSLREIEQLIEMLEAVRSAVVVVAGESARGKGLTAFCCLKDGIQKNADEIRKACFDILPGHSVPDHLELIDTMPMLPSGKIDRMALAGTADNVSSKEMKLP